MVKVDFDVEIVGKVADFMQDKGLTEVEIEQGDFCIRLSRLSSATQAPIMATTSFPAQAAPQAAPAAPSAPSVSSAADASSHPGALKSPIVGVAYLKPEPTANPFVKVGDTVKEGQTVMIVEAMKVMNKILAHKSGVIKEICVNDAQPVEYDDVLVIIE